MSSVVNVAIDMQTAEASLAPLLESLGDYLKTPNSDNGNALINNVGSSASAISGFASDILELAESNPAAAVALNTSGIIGVAAGARSLLSDLKSALPYIQANQPIPAKYALALAGDIGQIGISGTLVVSGGGEVGTLALGTAGLISLTGTVFAGISAFLPTPPDPTPTLPGLSVPSQVQFQNNYTGAWINNNDGTSTFQISNANGVVTNTITISTPAGGLPVITSSGGTITSDSGVPTIVNPDGSLTEIENGDQAPLGPYVAVGLTNVFQYAFNPNGSISASATSTGASSATITTQLGATGEVSTSGSSGTNSETSSANAISGILTSSQTVDGETFDITNPYFTSQSGQTYNALQLGVGTIYDIVGGNTLTTGGATGVTLVASSNDTVIGTSDSSTLVLNGTSIQANVTSETLDALAGSAFTVDGGANIINAATGAYVGLLSGSQADVINLSSGTLATQNGVGNSASDEINLYGSHNNIMAGSNVDMNISGSNITASFGNSSYVGLLGGSETASLTTSNSTIESQSDVGNTGVINIYGSYDIFSAGANVDINLSGSDISAQFGNDDYVGLLQGDQSTTLNISNGTVETQSDVGNDSGGVINIYGSNDTFNAGSSTSVQITGNTFNSIIGSNNYIGLISGDNSIDLNISDSTIATQNNVGDSGVIDIYGTGDTFTPGSNVDAQFFDGLAAITLDQADDISLEGGGDYDIVGSTGLGSGILNYYDDSSFTLDAPGTTVNGTGGSFIIASNVQGDVIDVSSAKIILDGTDDITLNGSGDEIIGNSDDNIVGDGQNDTIDADDSYVFFTGSNLSNDLVYGHNDTGPDPALFAGDGDGSGGDGDGGDGGVSTDSQQYLDFVSGDQNLITQDEKLVADQDQATGLTGVSVSALQWAATSASGQITASEAFEGAKWGAGVVTWSFAAGSPFTSGLSAAEQALVIEAFSDWAQASGLKFEQTPDSPTTDIRIGFGAFSTQTTGILGDTTFNETNGAFDAGVVVKLEDPAENPLVTDASGQLTYTNTGADFYQIVMHEIGHALGLADDNDPNSVMYYASSSTNLQLNATDISEANSLYGPTSSAPPLIGTSSAEVLDTKGLTNAVQGNGGDDTYIYGSGYGSLNIDNTSSTDTGPHGEISFSAGIDPDNLWFDQSGNNLIIDVLGTNNQVNVKDWFGADATAQTALLTTANGQSLTGTGVEQLVQSMASFEAQYNASTGMAFTPSLAASVITDPNILAAINSSWKH